MAAADIFKIEKPRYLGNGMTDRRTLTISTWHSVSVAVTKGLEKL